jgi:PAS domain S-box-containing protein
MPEKEDIITSCDKKMNWRSFLHTCGIFIVLCGFISTIGLASATDSVGMSTGDETIPIIDEASLSDQNIVFNQPNLTGSQYPVFFLGAFVLILLLILLSAYFIQKFLVLSKSRQELLIKIREQNNELKQAYQIIDEKSDFLSAQEIEFSALEIELRNKYLALLKNRRKLEESEEFHGSLLDSMQDMFYRLDENGVLLMVNKSFYKKCGYTSEDQILGKNITEFVYDAPSHKKGLDALAQKGSVSDIPFQFADCHGRPLYCFLSLRLLYDHNGAVIGREGLARDVTTEKTFEDITIRQNAILVE